jgi:predicted ATPase
MIRTLSIKNFKSHRNTILKLSKLNLLTGLNGVGKSSAIQSLLLLRQSFQRSMLDKGIELNADLCSIGVAEDALFQSAENDLMEFGIDLAGNDKLWWSFLIDDKKLSDTFLKLSSSNANDTIDLTGVSLFNQLFQYISAYRTGPVQTYEKNTSGVELFHQMSAKEGRCELIAHYIDFFKNDPITDESLKHSPDDKNSDLIVQVAKWMGNISPGIDLQVEGSESAYKINYSYSRGPQRTPTKRFSATNTGFGISYVLPIIVACLHMPKGSIVLIENPESHIHPDGQAKLMELICKAANAGIQFIVETHSDHIINGLLVAINRQMVGPNDSKIYFFDRDIASHATQPIDLTILEGGKIRKPPVGFFDRIDKDMKELLSF